MLKKSQRLSSGDFEALKAKKLQKTLKNPYFTAKIYENSLKKPRFGMVVSKAVDNRSTVRNKLKRLFFEGLGAIINTTRPADYVIIVNKSAIKAEKTLIFSELSKLSTTYPQTTTYNPPPTT